ncbi:hypothetical protein C2845_PM08G15600 [Panicum miliaceum]|uniref:CSC1-like protein n=1 Tax=Panicum miliaceum TaxID=4540 RepID=A0A3L6R3K2_PANMI|nr:hypothetical protein C2845_PM08G15600 [Panicum miliaceum]
MATIKDIGLSAAINVLGAIAFLLAFSFLRLQPINDRVYFPNWLKIFAPISILAFSVLVPVNWTNDTLEFSKRIPDQFTVLVRNIPPDPDESIGELVEHFFLVNHPDHYLTHQVVYNANKLAKLTGFLGCFGAKVDAIEYYKSEIERIENEEAEELEKIVKDPKSVVPAAFVSFRSRWGAAVCAQTQQTSNPTVWLTEWAPEPRDVYWDNLSIPFVSLTVRRLIVAVALFFLNFFYVIPIAFVQSLANLEGIEKAVPFLKPLIEIPTIKSFIQGFLPGIALKIFLILLPSILMFMSKVEGLTSISSLERRSASKYYIFIFFNVFLASIIAGSALEQLKSYLHQSANEIPRTVGVAIPMKATFFITYVMVDGWAGVAGEILRLKPLVIFHLKNFFLVKTEKDREEAMDPGSIGFDSNEPQIQLYFLLGLVYAAVTPFLLPFILIFFGFAYIVYRHQIINVYNQEYESAAAFWPSVHGRIITALIISQLLLLGLLSTKGAGQSTPVLLVLPVVTFYFHKYCKNRYEPTFVKCSLQEAMKKDTLERAREPGFDLKGYLMNAYIHPVFKGDDDDEKFSIADEPEAEQVLVATKRQSRRNTPVPSKYNARIHLLCLKL